MSERNVELARRGYEALARGDLEGLTNLLSPDLIWNGWDPGPGDCLNRREALAVIRERVSQNAIGELNEIVAIDDQRVLVMTTMPADSELDLADLGLAEGGELASLITFRDGQVVALRDFKSRDEALAAAAEGAAEHDSPRPQASPTEAAGATPIGRPSSLVPFVHVADLGRSIRFYETLGFGVFDRHDHEGELDWAFLEAGAARLMLARAGATIDPETQAVLFYLYSDDLSGLRERLTRAGVVASEIADGSPGPPQEMRVPDPDGYTLMIAQTENGRG